MHRPFSPAYGYGYRPPRSFSLYRRSMVPALHPGHALLTTGGLGLPGNPTFTFSSTPSLPILGRVPWFAGPDAVYGRPRPPSVTTF
jgi:hypothetical protein